MKTLLVDGPNVLSRADFAAHGKHVEMAVDGINTATLTLFVNLLSKYVRLVEPTHLAVLWDAGHTLRDQVYPGYKAKRFKPLVDPHAETPFLQAQEFLSLAGIAHKAMPGWEADDLIAATARQCEEEVVILSGDRDLLQLLRPGVTQIRLPDDEPWTEARVTEHYGYEPHLIPLAKALIGDPGDGVPGLRGIGPKKAVALLEEAGWDWEALLGLLGPERAAVASVMRSLVDLRYLDYGEAFMAMNAGAPAFTPTVLPGAPSLVAFLGRYRLKVIQERLEAGSLWQGRSRSEASPPGLFDQLI